MRVVGVAVALCLVVLPLGLPVGEAQAQVRVDVEVDADVKVGGKGRGRHKRPGRGHGPPSISVSGFSPQQGPVGTLVTITGSGFRPQTKVYMSGHRVRIEERTADVLRFRVPARGGDGAIWVRQPGRNGGDVQVGRFVVVVPPAPVISGFSPTGGRPGTRVRLTGSHFAPQDDVRYGKRDAEVLARSETWVDVVVPPSATTDERFFVLGPRGDAASPQPFQLQEDPIVARFYPPWGGVNTQVTIDGQDFAPGDAVVLGGRTCNTVSIHTKRIVISIPAGAATGVFQIVRGGQVVASSKVEFVMTSPPVISGFSPPSGPPGTQVVVTGAHFDGPLDLLYGTQPIPVTARTATSLTAEIPQDMRRSEPFVVRTRGGEARSIGVFQLALYSVIEGMSPNVGSAGTHVRIRGDFYAGDEKFFLNGVELPVLKRRRNKVVVKIPHGAATGLLEVESFGQRQTTRIRFEVIRPLVVTRATPATGPVETQVTISGDGFTNATTAWLGSIPLPVIRRAPPSYLLVQIPPGAHGTDYIYVEDAGGRARAPERFRVVAPGPVVSGFSPIAGPIGTQVAVTGQNFSPRATVWFGTLACPVVARTGSTSIIVTIPHGAVGRGYLVVEDHGRRSKSAQAFEVVAPSPSPPRNPGGGHHVHAHEHPHGDGGHHHHPHAHPHRRASDHHHPY